MTRDMFESCGDSRRDILILETCFDSEFTHAKSLCDFYESQMMITRMDAEIRVLTEGGDYDKVEDLCCEGVGELGEKLKNGISKMFEAVIKFIKGIVNKITGKAAELRKKSAEKKLTSDEWINSKEFNMEMNARYMDHFKSIDAQMTKGEQLLKRAGSSVGLTNVEVEGYINATRKLIAGIPKASIKFAAKATATAGGVILLAKNHKKLLAFIDASLSKLSSRLDKDKGVASAPTKKPEMASAKKEIAAALTSLGKTQADICGKISIGIQSLAVRKLGVISSKKKFTDYYNDSDDWRQSEYADDIRATYRNKIKS